MKPGTATWRPGWGWPYAGLTLLCVLAFWPAVNAGFSDFDDHGFLLETNHWRGLSPARLIDIFTTMRLGHYQPLTYLTHAVEYTLFGLNPAVFHVTNILLHCLSACLVARIAARAIELWRPDTDATSRLHAGLIAAMLWAAHPLRAESVAWITERRDVLSGALLLGAVLAYLHLPNRRAYRWTLALLALSLLSKAWGMTFFAVALLLDVCPLRRLPLQFWRWTRAEYRPVLVEKLPMLALGAVFGFIAAKAVAEPSEDTVKTIADWGVVERICQACYGLVFYVRKTLLPFNLAALYELPRAAGPSEPRFALAIGLVCVAGAALLWAAIKGTSRGVAIFIGFALYAVVVSPVLGLTQAGIQLVADRYAYLSTIPLFVLLAGAAIKSLDPSKKHHSTPLVGALIVAMIASNLTRTYSERWSDTRALWEAAFAAGQDGPVLRNFYGRQLEKAKEFTKAEEAYRASLAVVPEYGDSWFGLGNALRSQRRLDEAFAAYESAARFMADPVPAYVARGLMRVSDQSRPDLAVAEFAEAVRLTEERGNPSRTGGTYLLLAAAYGESGDDARAVEWLKRAVEFDDTRERAAQHLRDLGVR